MESIDETVVPREVIPLSGSDWLVFAVSAILVLVMCMWPRRK